MTGLLWVHLAACCMMTGIIWLVQVLVYPLFKKIGLNEFLTVHHFHMNQITWIVAPLMGLELFTGGWLLYVVQNQFYLINFLSIVALWMWTGLVNVPAHNRLEFGSLSSQKDLVHRNWPRTVLWTLRSIGLLMYLSFPQ